MPVDLEITNSAGSNIRLTETGAKWLSPYFSEFGSSAGYQVQIAAGSRSKLSAWLVTKAANIVIGGFVAPKSVGGALILLPDLDFEQPEFFERKVKQLEWTDAACQFASRLISSLVAVDKQWRAEAERSPEPAWVVAPVYALPREHLLRSELLKAERLAEEARARVDGLKDELAGAGHLRALLFEKGKPLESAIIEALKLIGFEAQAYRDDSSEFDVIFERDGGRLLGEAEGKDTKAINVDKLRQLAMNIHEDLAREEVSTPAKGVLFGNGFRLQPPNERGVQFTDKCIAAAITQSTALVTTSSLFSAAQYLSERSDEEYMTLCRDVLLTGSGLVTLPDPPSSLLQDAVEGLAEVSAAERP